MNDLEDLLGTPDVDTPVADDLFAPDFDAAVESVQKELDEGSLPSMVERLDGQLATMLSEQSPVTITSMVVHANMLYLALSDGRLIKSAQRRRNDPFEEVQYV